MAKNSKQRGSEARRIKWKWKELRQTMHFLSDHPFRVVLNGKEINENFENLRSDKTQTDGSSNRESSSSVSSLRSKKTNERDKANQRNDLERKKSHKPFAATSDFQMKLRKCNIAELCKIFEEETGKTGEASLVSHNAICREIVSWNGHIVTEMQQGRLIMEDLSNRMKQLKQLNKSLYDLLAYFENGKKNTTASATSEN